MYLYRWMNYSINLKHNKKGGASVYNNQLDLKIFKKKRDTI